MPIWTRHYHKSIMSQVELFHIDSPCIGVCEMNKKGYCIGCLRNRNERQLWHTFSDTEKHKVLSLLARRRQRLGDHRLKTRQAIDTAEVVQLGLLD